MTSATPAVLGSSIVQHLRSSRAGARPGDGTIRALLDGEIFINEADGVFCTTAANGGLWTSYTFNSAGIAALLSATAPFTLLASSNFGPDFDIGVQVPNKITLVLTTYRYKKAINASSTLTAAVPNGVLPVDAMISYAETNASNGSANSTVMMAATQSIPAPPGGDFETLVLIPWLTSLGYTPSSSPTIAALTMTLRAAALALSF